MLLRSMIQLAFLYQIVYLKFGQTWRRVFYEISFIFIAEYVKINKYKNERQILPKSKIVFKVILFFYLFIQSFPINQLLFSMNLSQLIFLFHYFLIIKLGQLFLDLQSVSYLLLLLMFFTFNLLFEVIFVILRGVRDSRICYFSIIFLLISLMRKFALFHHLLCFGVDRLECLLTSIYSCELSCSSIIVIFLALLLSYCIIFIFPSFLILYLSFCLYLLIVLLCQQGLKIAFFISLFEYILIELSGDSFIDELIILNLSFSVNMFLDGLGFLLPDIIIERIIKNISFDFVDVWR